MKFKLNTALIASTLGATLIVMPLASVAGNCGGKMGYGATAHYKPMLGHKAYLQQDAADMQRHYGYSNVYGASKANQMRFYKAAHHSGDSAKKATADIVDLASNAGSFNTLVSAIKAAGLVDTLKGDGPFTVFAPTDEAFAKIPEETLNALIADKDALTKVLTYHVVPGSVTSSEVVNLKSAETVQGSSISIDASDGVKIDNAKVIKTDIRASNGIIHVIDTVIMPN